jgi:hypothetical protein
MIGLAVGAHVSHRVDNEAAAIHKDGWIRYRHRHELAGIAAVFDTIILPDSDLHLRVHRVVESSEDGPVHTVEGAAALGFDPGDSPLIGCDSIARISGGVVRDHAVAIRAWDPHRAVRLPRTFGDGGRGNTVYGENVIPYLEGELAVGDIAMSVVFLGSSRQVRSMEDFAIRLADEPDVIWRDDGSVKISWRDREWTVAPLSDSPGHK